MFLHLYNKHEKLNLLSNKQVTQLKRGHIGVDKRMQRVRGIFRQTHRGFFILQVQSSPAVRLRSFTGK